jgi:hypothetical protein
MMYRTMYLQAIDTKSESYAGGFGKWLHLGTSSPKDTDIVSALKLRRARSRTGCKPCRTKRGFPTSVSTRPHNRSSIKLGSFLTSKITRDEVTNRKRTLSVRLSRSIVSANKWLQRTSLSAAAEPSRYKPRNE